MSFVLTPAPLIPALALAAVASDGAGATVSFLGTVRDSTRGPRRPSGLEYEAYEAMALAVFRDDRLVKPTDRFWPGWPARDPPPPRGPRRRRSDRSPSALSSPHRAAAFEACSPCD